MGEWYNAKQQLVVTTPPRRNLELSAVLAEELIVTGWGARMNKRKKSNLIIWRFVSVS